MDIIIRNWADRNAVVIEAITETSDEVKIYVSFVHLHDLMSLDKIANMEKGFHVAFVNPMNDDVVEIQLLKI